MTPLPSIEKSTAARHAQAEARKEVQKELQLHWTWKFAVVKKCKNCSNNQRKEITECTVLTCSCWPGRTGHMCSNADLKRWEAVFVADPLNKEILGELEIPEVVRVNEKDW